MKEEERSETTLKLTRTRKLPCLGMFYRSIHSGFHCEVEAPRIFGRRSMTVLVVHLSGTRIRDGGMIHGHAGLRAVVLVAVVGWCWTDGSCRRCCGVQSASPWLGLTNEGKVLRHARNDANREMQVCRVLFKRPSHRLSSERSTDGPFPGQISVPT